ncbi:precorrin-2 C(20)-methyltransferase [Methyloceanibacter stevinii]|uniref:Precorrin-2 C(20)-methyltransferase n=1 Tax=Methyloceanibacter stevinii TaxID=1774970 RepID=A0A1E3VR04_9HYPH|nr:precorrin-2 C(20)-methyltransferase [Methyloceanibacter stevinii]ODR95960.1 precorrin-2 C(20)-methyltransferase [Methyloceanibacter stevinii]
MTGRLIGVGVGPGDPELLTVKALKALQSADVVAYFARPAIRAMRGGSWKAINGAEELPLLYPVTTEIPKAHTAYRDAIADFYDVSAAAVSSYLDDGRDVAVLSEGDPLFYGSYMHIHVRLSQHYPTEVIPGVTGMSGCWSSAAAPITQGDDIFTVLPGTLPEVELERRLADSDAAVVMKIGRHLPKIRRACERAGCLDRAIYVERGTMTNSAVMKLTDKLDVTAPYFAIVLVPGWEERR